jgi:Protein of unknown function (DUF3108)
VPQRRTDYPPIRGLLLWLMAAAMGMTADDAIASVNAIAPSPFVAKFAIEWKGITAGFSTLELVRTAPDTYTYRSRNLARGIFRLAFPDAISQESTISTSNGEVRPLSYHADDGERDSDKAVTLQFDWQARRVTGVAEKKPVDLTLERGTQDSLSVQIALMQELAAGRSPKSFWLIDNDAIKEYMYTREGTTTLDTPLGKLETVIYRSERAGSDRVTRLWLAPSLGFLPVRAERSRAGRIDFGLSIRELKTN